MNLNKLRQRITTVSFLIIFIPALNIYTQPSNIRFKHLSIDDGLSQSSVFRILQDSKGFMWFGTYGGLNKYDGYNFTVYKTDIYDTTSISDNAILSTCKDHNGMMWIGTEGGLNRFDPAKNSFTQYFHNPNESNSISNNRVNSICEDGFKELWIGTDNGLNRFNQERNQFVRYFKDSSNQNSISSNDVRAVYRDKSGTIWIGTYGGGLNKFDRKTGRFTSYLHDARNANSLSDNYVLCVYEDRNGILWIGTEKGGLSKFDKGKEQFTCYKAIPDDPYSINDNHINVIYEDKSGRLWIGTHSGGVSIFDREEEKFFSFQNDPDNPNSLSDNRVHSILEDNTGNIWIGSYSYGMNIYNQEAEKFVHYHHEYQNSNSLSDNTVWGIYEDTSRVLWLGTNTGGLNKFDREKNIFTHYFHDKKNPHSISSNMVVVLYEDKSGVLWLGTNEGLDKFIRETEQFTHYTFDPDNPYSISNDKIRSIYEDRSGTLWIGSRGGGLNRFDRETGHFTRYKHDPDDSTSISNNRVYCLYEDQSNNFWVGTNGGGLNKFNREKEEFTHYKTDPKNKNSLSSNNVITIHEDIYGNLWLGTYGGGLNKFNREKGIFTHYTEKSSLSNNEVYTILEDNKGNLWLSTNRGLLKFDPGTETFKIYYVEDGLQSNEFNMFAAFKNQNGEMFFGGPNGFNAFFPDSIIDNPFPPSIVITGFKLSNKPVPIGQMPDGRTILEKPILETKKIMLSYRDKVISFEFAALHYVAPDKNQYAYIMEGLEKEWNYVASNRRFVTYSGLPPGKYVFKVKGSNNDGVWNEESASLRVTIIPPFWRTWWFYTLCVIVIASLIVMIFIYQINKIKKKKEEEARLKVITDVGQVLEHGSATIYRRNLDSDVYDYIGNGIKDITGYSPEEFTPPLWYKIVIREELIGEYSGLSVEEAYKRMRDGSINSFISDFNLRTKSGDVRWARDITTALRDESGVCNACFGIIFDITDRKLAEKKLARLSEELRIKNKEMEKDLDMARDVQMALLSQNYPKNFPENVPPKQSALQFSHRYIPASTLAGDFFEIFSISDHQVGVMIYDVMGHGVRASLLTAYLHGLVEELMPIAADPVMFIKRLNVGLSAIMEQFLAGMFATAFYLVADIKKGKMYFTNAGHPKPYIIRRSAGTVEKLGHGKKHIEPALGLFNRFNYTASECSMKKDDIILFFTDGVYEVVGTSKEIFGEKQLMATVKNKLKTSPEKMLDEILQEINTFSGTDEFSDDVCLVSMHVKKASL